jgi:hypothetical protein
MFRKIGVLLLLLLLFVSPSFGKDKFISTDEKVDFSEQITLDGDWQTGVLTPAKDYSYPYVKLEPAGAEGGLKAWVRKGSCYWWAWTVGSAAERVMNNWELRASIRRLDKGGSGLMFGKKCPETGKFLAVYLREDKLTLLSFDAARGRSWKAQNKILHEVKLKPEHQQPAEITLYVSLDRGARVIHCSVNDTEYMNLGISKEIKELPPIENYGFFIGSFQQELESNAIFRKIETRRSK